MLGRGRSPRPLPFPRLGIPSGPDVQTSRTSETCLPRPPRAEGQRPAMNPREIERYKSMDRKYLCATGPDEKDIVVESSHGCVIRAADGREFLDLIAGIAVCNVGHCNPEVAAAIKEQADQALHTMVYGKFVVPIQVELAELLAQITPAPLQTSFLTNSGTEAIEGALKLARKYTGRSKFISTERGFHGRTFGALSVTSREIYRN